MGAPFILTVLSEDGYQVFAALYREFDTLERAIEGAKADYLKRYGGNPAFRVYHAEGPVDGSGFSHTLIEACFDETKRRSFVALYKVLQEIEPTPSRPGPLRWSRLSSARMIQRIADGFRNLFARPRALAAALPVAALLMPIVAASLGQERRPSPATRLASIRSPLESQAALVGKKEHCSADPDFLRSIGRAGGQQIRVYRSEDDFAIFTAAETPDEPLDSTLRMGRLARLRVGTTAEFDGRVGPVVVVPGLTEAQARARGELFESLVDDGKGDGLLIMAPHGGELEPPTDLQAERLAEALKAKRPTTWLCKGFHPRGGKAAFDRWHITSTDISEASYPLLAKVATRKFRFAVSFHGMTDDRVLIGGAAPTRLRTEIRDAIRLAIDDPKLAVDLAMPGDANGGKDARNIVNRYALAGGVQIEQSPRARREHWKEIADAVAKVFASKL